MPEDGGAHGGSREQRGDDPQRDREMTGAQHERPDNPGDSPPAGLFGRQRARRLLRHDAPPSAQSAYTVDFGCGIGGYAPPRGHSEKCDAPCAAVGLPSLNRLHGRRARAMAELSHARRPAHTRRQTEPDRAGAAGSRRQAGPVRGLDARAHLRGGNEAPLRRRSSTRPSRWTCRAWRSAPSTGTRSIS